MNFPVYKQNFTIFLLRYMLSNSIFQYKISQKLTVNFLYFVYKFVFLSNAIFRLFFQLFCQIQHNYYFLCAKLRIVNYQPNIFQAKSLSKIEQFVSFCTNINLKVVFSIIFYNISLCCLFVTNLRFVKIKTVLLLITKLSKNLFCLYQLEKEKLGLEDEIGWNSSLLANQFRQAGNAFS